MSKDRVVCSISRLVDVLADKSSIGGIADCVFPMNSTDKIQMHVERTRTKGPHLVQRIVPNEFPYVGVLKMDEDCAVILGRYSGVYCDTWHVHYGSLKLPILLPKPTSIGFSSWDGNESAMDFFSHADEIQATTIREFDSAFRINAIDPKTKGEIFLQFLNEKKSF